MPLFVDQAPFAAKAGNGGNGCVSFHREKFLLNGGPDGGDGGHGGSVVLLADGNMHTLLDFRVKAKYWAENGEDGRGGRCSGKNGADLVIKVPVGTVVRAENGQVVADMYTDGQQRVLLHGGRGGWGNAHFATPTRQAPNFAKPGVQTQAFRFTLELKTIADVGLVGFPNVGKSTILSVVTRAQPKIANYHFTTLTPNLGIVRRHGQDLVMADIPGLVEGAADGAGLGHDFLRHIERTRLLIHVIDMAGSEGRDPLEDYAAINQELDRYGDLKNRPQIVAANKMDLPDGQEYLAMFREQYPDVPVYPVSAAAHQGFDELLDAVEKALAALPPAAPFEQEEFLDDLPDLSGYTVRREGSIYVVEGAAMQRLIDSVNFEDTDSMKWFHMTLRRTGVIDALRKAGAGEGDTVQIEDMQFDFID
ncbi:MAG: GTPase ObgE [Clostridia bacterium]|nr:GTPase ObgE [Clostridia bacterium]